ncbi:MAG: hypothetical protein M1838_002144 [Thelocarpon superellum]|nr:MAG: hypothetical protein M1838_002144 [Thelocarpon superellum]
MAEQDVDSLAYTKPLQITKTIHRDPYPSLSPDKPELSPNGKIVLVTGGGSGIGAAAAKVWAKAGAAGVVIAGRRVANLEQVLKELRASAHAGAQVQAVPTDVTRLADVTALFAAVQTTFGRAPDVVIHSAGYLEDAKPVGQVDPADWLNSVNINLVGTFNVAHSYIKALPNPQDPSGTFVSVSSGMAGLTIPGNSGYSIAKLGMQRLNEHLDIEYPHLRTFTISPGVVATDMPPAAFRPYAHDHEDLTGLWALYLAQPRADYLKGSLIGVNWDVDEVEAHKDEIESKKLLKTAWINLLPLGGGPGLA